MNRSVAPRKGKKRVEGSFEEQLCCSFAVDLFTIVSDEMYFSPLLKMSQSEILTLYMPVNEKGVDYLGNL